MPLALRITEVHKGLGLRRDSDRTGLEREGHGEMNGGHANPIRCFPQGQRHRELRCQACRPVAQESLRLFMAGFRSGWAG